MFLLRNGSTSDGCGSITDGRTPTGNGHVLTTNGRPLIADGHVYTPVDSDGVRDGCDAYRGDHRETAGRSSEYVRTTVGLPPDQHDYLC